MAGKRRRHDLRTPFYGSRRMAAWLQTQSHAVNRKRVQRLIRLMGIAGLAPKPGASRKPPGHTIYPYLLDGFEVTAVNRCGAPTSPIVPYARG